MESQMLLSFLSMVVFTMLTLTFLLVAYRARHQGWYIAAATVPGVWFLAAWGLAGTDWYDGLNETLKGILYPLQPGIESWFWMPLVLWFIIYLVYIWHGVDPNRHATYKRLVAPWKAMWTVGGAVVLVSALVVFSLFVTIEQRGASSPLLVAASMLVFTPMTLALLLIAYRTRYQVWYFASAFVPAVWFLSPWWLEDFLPEPLGIAFGTWFWMPLVLWFMVFLVYVWRGVDPERHTEYKEIIAPRKAVWTAFGAVILGLALVALNQFQHIERHMDGLRPVEESLIRAIEDTQTYAVELTESARSLQPESTDTGSRQPESTDTESLQPDSTDTNEGFMIIGSMALEVEMQAETALSLLESGFLDVSLPYQPTQRYTETAKLQKEASLEQICFLMGHIISRTTKIRSLASSTASDSGQVARVQFLAEEVREIASDLAPTTALLVPDRSNPFIVITGLFVFFLLFPWLLYLSFILSRRSMILRDARTALSDLGLIDRLLQTSEGPGDEEQRIARSVALNLTRAANQLRNSHVSPEQVAMVQVDVDEAQRTVQKRYSSVLEKLAGLIENVASLLETGDSTSGEGHWINAVLSRLELARDAALEIVIVHRRFYSREYIIPLVALTVLTGVGWYFTFFPDARAGLVDLIMQGGTATVFSKYLTGGFTLITMCFAGAWLYTTVMLTTRWAQEDLYPRSFFYAAIRLAIAFLVGILFASWYPDSASSELGYVLAFVVGAAPIELINAIFRGVARGISDWSGKIGGSPESTVLGEFSPPDWSSQHSLRDLEDLTIWDEVRLYQEGVQNVHALATADLERLILNTPFPAQNLIDWVDQALLHVHAKDLWRPGLEVISMRTATGLLDFCWPEEDAMEPDSDRVASIVTSFNQAQSAAQGKDDSADGATGERVDAALPLQMTQEILRVMLVTMRADPNVGHVRSFWHARQTLARQKLLEQPTSG